MYVLHIGNKNYSSWSLRPWALLRVLGIAFEERLTPFLDGDNWAQFRAFSPNGKVPCLVADDAAGETVVWDSLAICEFLSERHDGVWPTDAAARTWARCAAAEMHSGFASLRNLCPMNCGIRVALREVPVGLQRDLDRLDELLGEGLRRFDGEFLAGSQFGAVDAMFVPVAFRFQSYGLPFSSAVSTYFQHLLSLDAIRQWEAAALMEPWRDEAHEREALEAGCVLEDRRTG